MMSMAGGSNLPLFRFSETDDYYLLDAFSGMAITGGTGSGKSSASGFNIAASLLHAGCGGIVLCAKGSELARWKMLARRTNRSASLVILSPQQAWHLNILDYELNRAGAGAGITEHAVTLVGAIKNMVEGNGSDTNQQYWDRAANQLVRNAIPLLKLSEGRLMLTDLVNLILSSPVADQAEDVMWQRESFFARCLQAAEHRPKTPREQHELMMARRYWLEDFGKLADRTRSSIVSSFTTIADIFNGFLYDLYCTDTTIVPEATYLEGAVIIMDFPIREYGQSGVLAQKIFKLMFQRAILRRDPSIHTRPVFLYCDEAHNFIDGFDYQYQSEARESRAATVYITQNISNYYAAVGQSRREEMNALLGHFQTKIFHANSDPITNLWAAETIGKEDSLRKSWGASSSYSGMALSVSHSDQQEYKVNPTVFTKLRRGGSTNGWEADAILFQSGRIFEATGEPWINATFSQLQSMRALPARVNQPEASPALQSQQETKLPPEALLVVLLVLLEWFHLVPPLVQLIGDMVSAEYIQSLLQKRREALPERHLVRLIPGGIHVPPPKIEATVQAIMFPSARSDGEENAWQDAEVS